MKIRLLLAVALGLALGAATWGQDAPPAPQQNQNSEPGLGGGWSQRGGRSGMGMGGMGMGRAVHGTVTGVAADHYTVKTFTGEIYTIHFSANTRMLKQSAGMRGDRRGQGGENGGGQSGERGSGQGYGRGGNPPQPIKAADIKVGDAVAAVGDVDASAKSVGATYVLLMDPERARQMQQMEADYGKTWLMGRVAAINGVSVTLTGVLDNAPHTFAADENTTFRKRREPIALTDIQVGDMVRADGAVKDGAFTATTVNIMGGQSDARVPRNGQAPAEDSPAPQ